MKGRNSDQQYICKKYSTLWEDKIQLLESPIPAAPPAVSQKASSDDISGTKRGTIDPLVSTRPEKHSDKKKRKKRKKMVKNGQKLSKMVKIVKMV